MSLLDMDAILAQTAKGVAQMNQPAAPGEATREYYREQGRQQERQRMTETEAIRENYKLGVLAGEARERQRIIDLVNSLDITIEEAPDGVNWIVGDALDLIALIKGEK